jgi:hypothetical protein
VKFFTDYKIRGRKIQFINTRGGLLCIVDNLPRSWGELYGHYLDDETTVSESFPIISEILVLCNRTFGNYYKVKYTPKYLYKLLLEKVPIMKVFFNYTNIPNFRFYIDVLYGINEIPDRLFYLIDEYNRLEIRQKT